jgi:nucleotide-binding universal stress UspA family protein
MFQKILVPCDGSSNAEKSRKMAGEIAERTGAELLILTVYRHYSMLEASLSMVRTVDPGRMDDAMRDHAHEVCEHAKSVARQAGATRVRGFIKPGQPARTIVAFAKEKGVDLIVLSSRGLGSVEEYLLGSVSHKVTGLAECPVLVV